LRERRVAGYAGPRRKILVADDDPDHVELLHDFLQPLGFVMYSVVDGDSCVLAAETCLPDLLILDIAMPGTSGLDVAAALRERFEDLKILIVSGNFHDAPRIKGDGGEHPHDAFLTKPIDIRALLEQLRALLELSWIYEAEPALTVPVLPNGQLAVPDKHLADLLQLGRIGYVRGIEAKLDEIDQAEPDMADFTAYLRDLVGRFELGRYMTYLETLAGVEP
jgi:CheY-like chemotaxis protein